MRIRRVPPSRPPLDFRNPRVKRRAWLLSPLLVATAFSGCRATRPSHLPETGGALVAVKSCALDPDRPWWMRWAHHAFVDVRHPDGHWERVESAGSLGILRGQLSPAEARCDERFSGRSVRLLGWVEGEAAERAIVQMEAALPALAKKYDDGYTKWPGPNSNTFVHELMLHCDDVGFVFDPNSLGKDYGGWIDVGRTASKTGLRLDTPIVGAAIGLREGVEVHLLQTTIGISLDPPGLSLPFLPQIPWGWLPTGAKPDLRATAEARTGATCIDLTAGDLDGSLHELGSLALPCKLVFDDGSGRGWLVVDVALDTENTLGGRPMLEVETTSHGVDGESGGSTQAPIGRGNLCVAVGGAGESLVRFAFDEVADGRVRIAWRAFAEAKEMTGLAYDQR